MKYSQNTPLTKEQVKQLPRRVQSFEINEKGHMVLKTHHDGFTPTSVGLTGQQLKQLLYRRAKHPSTNRKETKGRDVQRIPIYARDAEGNKLINIVNGKQVDIITGYKKIVHLRPEVLPYKPGNDEIQEEAKEAA